jgi:predicted branched-subunit amino acid permease
VAVAHLASEIGVAAAIDAGQHGERAARRAFFELVLASTAGWIIGSAIGLVVGNVVGDTRAIGLDVVFPASFVGAVVNALRRQDSTVAVGTGAVAALALTPLLPAGVPVLIAAAGSLVAMAAPPKPWRRMVSA